MKKPKDTMFTKWVSRLGSVGDLGPGYPIEHFIGEPTRLTKILVSIGVSKIHIIDFDRGLTRMRNKLAKKLLHVSTILWGS